MLSAGEEEDSAVIDTRALEMQRRRQTEAPPSGVLERLGWFALSVVRAITGPYQLLGLALLVAAFIAWLRLR